MEKGKIVKSDYSWFFFGLDNIKMGTKDEIGLTNGFKNRLAKKVGSEIKDFIRNTGRGYKVRRDVREDFSDRPFSKTVVKKGVSVSLIKSQNILNKVSGIFLDSGCSALAEEADIDKDIFGVAGHQLQAIMRGPSCQTADNRGKLLAI